MTDWAEKGAVLLEAEAREACARCLGVKSQLWAWPDDVLKDYEWFFCPCCGCRIRTADQIQASGRAKMAEHGMTEEEYSAHCRSLFAMPWVDDLDTARKQAEQFRGEWTPACEHDTKNPWAA